MKHQSRNIGQIIREARRARGMTQMQLSELIGVSYQQVQKYEKGSDNISVERLKQIAKAVNLPVTAFFGQPESVAEAQEPYGKMTEEEAALVRMFRRLKSKKARKTVVEFLKTFTRE